MTPSELFVYQFGDTEYIPSCFLAYYVFDSHVRKCGISRDDPNSVEHIESLEFDHWLSKESIDGINEQIRERMKQHFGVEE